MSGLHPLNREVVRQTDAWFYREHPRGWELHGRPLHPTSAEDAEGRRAWVAEYRRRLAARQAASGSAPAPGGQVDPLAPCRGCCPTGFLLSVGSVPASPSPVTLEVEEDVVLSGEDISGAAGFGAGTYRWTTASPRLSLGGATSPRIVQGPTVTVHAGSVPSSARPGELVEVTRSQPGCAPLTRQVRIFVQRCRFFRLAQPRIIAIASAVPAGVTTFADPQLPGGLALSYGQDLTFSMGRAIPHGYSVGTHPADLERQMRVLLSWWARGDTHLMATRLVEAFLAPHAAVAFWSDPDLTAVANTHPNIVSFINMALSAPNSPERSPPGATRIHQALEQAGWDINAVVPPTRLGPPAFNRGNRAIQSEDWGNGLALMINGVQHAVVVARDYYYDRCNGEYYIRLEYVFYDVFGLDDIDLDRFGTDSGIASAFDTDAHRGISAWWQLQHQHGYVPLITRISLEREFRVPAPPPAGGGRP